MRAILCTLHSKFIHNSLALPCLAAYCREVCDDILIREFTTHEPRGSILGLLLKEAPDIVLFSVYLWNRTETLALVDALATASPDIRIVLGGPEVSFDGEELFAAHPGLTALVRGEGEEPLRELLSCWKNKQNPGPLPRVLHRQKEQLIEGPDSPPLTQLDTIPSPFRAGLVSLERGIVYYETSRGCPFRCSFCLSARDDRVRSYSMARIRDDLSLLMESGVPQVKLVDRTFNYDPERAREIFAFIIKQQPGCNFHFEIAAHLLDETTLDLLEQAPPGLFQFEIGVQSTLERTLDQIERRSNLGRLEANVRRLLKSNRIHLHLDLVAGLPGEGYEAFLDSIDRVLELQPHHLQVEPVKLLRGAPLRDQATERALRYDPNPPYTLLESPDLTFDELQRLQEISRLLDLTYNSGRFPRFLADLESRTGTLARGLVLIAEDWRKQDLFRFPMNRHALFDELVSTIERIFADEVQAGLREALAYDYACCERVVPKRVPPFFDIRLSDDEQRWAQEKARERLEEIKGKGLKLQYFAAAFSHLEEVEERRVILFIYLTGAGRRMQVEEFSPDSQKAES